MSGLRTRSPNPLATRSIVASIKAHVVLLLGFLAVMWAVEILDLLPFLDLDSHGIHPRTVAGLFGILFAPLLHDGFGHLAANSIPFLMLGGVVLIGGTRVFWRVTIFVVLVGGLSVWLCAGAASNHIGASGLIFGYLGFLLARGHFEKSSRWMLAACLILIAYGGLLFGVLPFHSGVSWQSHLFGFLSGIGAARALFPPGRRLLR